MTTLCNVFPFFNLLAILDLNADVTCAFGLAFLISALANKKKLKPIRRALMGCSNTKIKLFLDIILFI